MQNIDDKSALEEPPRPYSGFDVVWSHAAKDRKDIAASARALKCCESILVRPVGAAKDEMNLIMARVRAMIPSALLPRICDTTRSLTSRLAASDFLDEIYVLKGGCGPRRIRLNNTAYPQPRRVTYSDEAKVDVQAEEGYIWLYAYTQFGRLPEDWRCRLMPDEIKALRHKVHALAKATGTLSPACALCEPTAMQLMMYYAAFGSGVGRHRDNFCSNHLVQQLSGMDVMKEMESGHSASGDQNSQIVGSDVLIWSDGNANMVLKLSFPDPELEHGQARTEYIVHPHYCINMGSGTLFIFKAIDDLYFCHEAAFEPFWIEFAGNGGYRFAYVFRWLQSVRMFSAKYPYAMKVPKELQAKVDESRAKKKRKAARDSSWMPGR